VLTNLDPADAKLLFKKVAQEVDLKHTGPNKRCKLEECLLSCPFAHHLLHPHYYMLCLVLINWVQHRFNS